MKNTMENSKHPFVSVIIPTYNRGYIIEKAIDSVLDQSYKNFEIIIVDDCSSDNTAEVINKYNYLDNFTYIVLDSNKGGNYARNYGVSLAKYDYIAFQDSDDYWHINKLELQMNFLIQGNYDFIGCKYVQKSEDNNIVVPSFDVDADYFECGKFLSKNAFSTQTFLGKKGVFFDEKFDNDMTRLQDWDIVIRIIQKYHVGYINSPLVDVYVQKNSISKDYSKFYTSVLCILKKYKNLYILHKKMNLYYFRIALYSVLLKIGFNYNSNIARNVLQLKNKFDLKN